LLVVVPAVLAACSGASGPDADALVGSWQATKIEYRSTRSPAAVDLVAGGGSGSLVLDADGTFTFSVTPPAGPPESFTGTWEASGDVMTIRRSDRRGEMQFDLAVAADVLSLSGADAEFDFDGDGRDEPAKLDLAFRR
jgi:hypothetical protein